MTQEFHALGQRQKREEKIKRMYVLKIRFFGQSLLTFPLARDTVWICLEFAPHTTLPFHLFGITL